MKLLVACILTLIVLSPLQARKKTPPPPLDPRITAITNIVVLPVVDARAGKKASVNLDSLRNSVVKTLDRKHYPAAAGAAAPGAEIAIEDAQAASPAFIKNLGTPDQRWVFLVFLNDVVSKVTFGSTGNAQMSGFLFDKQDAQLIWSANGVGQAGQGGLIGIGFKAMMKGEAINAAIMNLLAQLPNRPKPSK